MTQTCPISFNRVDANFVRIIAAQVISIALLLIFTQELIFALILLIDFSVRILNLKQLSILAYVAKFIIKYFNIEAQPCDEAPKRFALYVGVVIIALFTVLYLFQFNIMASILVSILLLCAFLEATFDYCVGCKVYHLLQYIRPKDK
ncbi:MAG: Unknown protein [uncultured Sulfurovum sp.]|uniref:DUF4395 domain-containing protein n=1 Tax=uncultured Sulfurovum sp. TaxID=269237 RepID=A0A6S6TU22_9BACT|nr:MAG: Unknown protein [uncultured Sulfurovum sp.]